MNVHPNHTELLPAAPLADAPADSTNDSKPAGRPSLVRRAVAILVMLVSLVGISGTVAANPASAATYSTASVCFTQRGGGAFTGQVAVEYWTTDAGWFRTGYMTLDSSGCESVRVVGGWYVRFAVTQRGFYGATNYQYIYNGYNYRFYGVATWYSY